MYAYIYLYVCVHLYVPGSVDCHVLISGSSQDTKELIKDGGEKVDQHMTFHGMKTLGWDAKQIINV